MADSDSNQDELEVPAKGGSKLVLIVALVNLIATAAVAAKVMTAAAPPAPASGDEKEVKTDKPGPVQALDPFVVNLNEPAGGRFLKAVLEIELVDKDAAKALTEALRPIRDDLLAYLSNLKVKETMGEDAKLKIKKEIVARLDKRLGGPRVKRVFLAQFVVQ